MGTTCKTQLAQSLTLPVQSSISAVPPLSTTPTPSPASTSRARSAPSSPGTTNGFAIGNYGPSVSVTMNVACATVTSSMATVTFVDASTCSFVLDVPDARAALLIFEADTQSIVDFFAVSVQ